MEITKKDRKKLIEKISKASGVAQYALELKMSNEQIIEADNNLEILGLIKAANNYNRYCQSQKTAEANKKLKEFVDKLLVDSEIIKAGKWLIGSLSKVGKERLESLKEKDLVHKDDYNQAVTEFQDTVQEQKLGIEQQTNLASKTIQDLENRIDSLQLQQIQIKSYIVNNYGIEEWKNIANYF